MTESFCPIASTLAINPEFVSALVASTDYHSPLHDDGYVSDWLKEARGTATQKSMMIPLESMRGWIRQPQSGIICHETGRFFSITGVSARHRIGRTELEWDQPIIDQPEIGILGILARRINGLLHFCLQAKEEPGNIGRVQLSPTVQATYSNYTGAHGGKNPLFLEHFIDPPEGGLIFARLQTEDGGRFLYKSNRNMIVCGGDDLPLELPEGFIWLTLRQIAALITGNSMAINACTRSILSSLLFAGRVGSRNLYACDQEELQGTLQWLDDRRSANHMLVKRIGLSALQEWQIDGKGFFSHQESRFFRIVGLSVTAGTREVASWDQPIIENPAPGIIGLLLRWGPNGPEVLMQAKAEVGNRTTVQLGPTVQFTQGNYEGSRKLLKPFLYDEFLLQKDFGLLHESRQTEEGARFYREYNLHRILKAPASEDLNLPPDYRWLPLSHVLFLLHLGEQVNSCARSILSCLL